MSKLVPHLGFGGKVYPYRREENTARIVRRVRQDTGMSVLEAERQLVSDARDIDGMAVLYYTAALQAGDDLNFEALLDEVTSVDPITFEAREVDDDPEI